MNYAAPFEREEEPSAAPEAPAAAAPRLDAVPPQTVTPQPPPRPELASRPLLRVDPRLVASERLGSLLAFLPLGGSAAVVSALLLFAPTMPLTLRLTEMLPGGRGLYIGILAFVGISVLWRVVAPALAYQRLGYRVDDQVLVVEHGIVVHRSVLIPLTRVQHVDVRRGPIERAFGLATLIVKTAGTGLATAVLPGLPPERADELREHLLARAGLVSTDRHAA